MKKLSIAFLLLIILTSFLMTSCNNTADDTSPNAVRVERPVEETAFSAREAEDDGLPEMNYDGAEFHILARDRDDFKEEIGVELKQSEEVVSNAIFNRNKEVEERFGVKLVATHVATPYNDIKKTVKAGLNTYDLYVDHVINACGIATDGVFYAIDELEYVNIEKPWYMKSATDAISVGGKSFFLAGDFCLSLYKFTYCMYYNKNMLAKYPDVENPHTVVKEGRWTIDYVNNLVKDFYFDLNGNGHSDPDDQFGFASDWHSAVVTYNYALDNPVMKMDNDGVPQLSYNTPKMANIVQKVYELFHENPGSFTGTWGATDAPRREGRVFLWNALFSSSAGLRDADFEFGIVPYPKYDEDQEEYYTMVDGAHSIMAVPMTADAERASIIVEALNAESYKKVIPAYYETDLKIKGARGDEEAAEILDMISKGVKFDFGYVYNSGGGVGQLISQIIAGGNANFASAYDKAERAAIKHYNRVIEKYQDLM